MNISPPQLRAWKDLLHRALKLIKPPPSLPVWAWGELRRRMGKNVTAKPGRYRISSTPYQKKPQESFTDPDVQTTVLYWAKRLGKTEMLNNLHGSTIEQNPRNILVVYPTLDSAKKWSKQFFSPMVKSTPALKVRIRDARKKDANNTILSKEFPGGCVSAIGANSPSGFRQVQAPVVTCDEIDAMEDGPEGDPVTLAFGRAENYKDSIQVVSSTATSLIQKPKDGEIPEGGTGSRIHDWWLRSDQQKWFVPCGCGKWHVLAWSQVKWPKTVSASGRKLHDLEKAYYETPCCGAKWSDYDRTAAILAGEWQATAPFRGVRGYWLNGLNTTFPAKKGYKSKLHQFAAEFMEAYTSGESARISWKNTFLCEPHEELAEKLDASPLIERCEDYTPQTLPTGVVLAGCAVDVQGDRLEYEIVGMGDAEETWGIEYGKLMGDPEKDDVWKSLDGIVHKTFKRTDGVELKISCVAIDHRHRGDRVRRFIKNCGHPRVYAVYGNSGAQSILVIPHHNKKYRMFLYSVNTDAAKDTIFARVKLKDHGARFMHYPKTNGYEPENKYFEGLTAEEARIKFSEGFPKRYYWKDPNKRNEPLDLRVYFLAAMDILKPSIRHIASGLVPNQPPSQPKDYTLNPDPVNPAPPPVQKQKPIIRPFRTGGFVGGWKK
jgi:phage terminase large subunit GpA-like protein